MTVMHEGSSSRASWSIPRMSAATAIASWTGVGPEAQALPGLVELLGERRVHVEVAGRDRQVRGLERTAALLVDDVERADEPDVVDEVRVVAGPAAAVEVGDERRPADGAEDEVGAAEDDVPLRVAGVEPELGRRGPDQLLGVGRVQADASLEAVDPGAGRRERVQHAVTEDLEPDLGQDPERRAVDGLHLVGRQDLERPERVRQAAPWKLLDRAAGPPRPAAMGLGGRRGGVARGVGRGVVHVRVMVGAAAGSPGGRPVPWRSSAISARPRPEGRDSHGYLRVRAWNQGRREPPVCATTCRGLAATAASELDTSEGTSMKLKIVAVLVLVVVGVGAAVFALGGIQTGTAASTEYLTSAATTGDVTDDVAATGTLAAQSRYGLVLRGRPVPGHRQQHRAVVHDDLPRQGGQGRRRRQRQEGRRPGHGRHGRSPTPARRGREHPRLRAGQPPRRELVADRRQGRRRHRADPPGHDRGPQRREPARPGQAGGQRPQDADRRGHPEVADRRHRHRVEHQRRLRRPVGHGDRRRLARVPGHDRRGRERPRRRQGRPDGVGLGERGGRGHRRDRLRHLAGRRHEQRQLERRVLSGDRHPHGRTGDAPLRDDGRRHHHDRERERGPDGPGGRPPRHDRGLQRPDPRRGGAAPAPRRSMSGS